MDALTPKSQKSGEEHSHVVRPADMQWQQTRFPGCEVKTLLFDRTSGLVTALMRFAPGAVLPDHEHVKIEQTYVLEGKLVDKEGPAAGLEVKPGEFVWRECGSRHVAWTPECGLMLAPGGIRGGGLTPRFLANALGAPAGRIVVDHTGLEGSFDFELTYAPPGRGGTPPPVSDDRPSVS